ncbi:MAG: formylglycine-generating enzyme family protein, partial [Planctomycetes bacterium]|nr:formylglycine-generating enzyme family protein [Planctomycetota bacterium]
MAGSMPHPILATAPAARRSAPTVWDGLADKDDIRWPLPNGAEPMRFRPIPAGEFVMGSRGENPNEEPRHRVVIPSEYRLGKFVVTQAEWAAVVEACNPMVKGKLPDPRPSRFRGDRRPVEQVSWDDCVAWCRAWQAYLERERPAAWEPGWRVGLPSEAQWEYACRAGSETDYWNGDGEAALREVGWFGGNSGEETHDVDEPVVTGVPEQHPAGLVGMHGNVWEWCADVFDAGAYRKREDRWQAIEERPEAEAELKEDRLRVIR